MSAVRSSQSPFLNPPFLTTKEYFTWKPGANAHEKAFGGLDGIVIPDDMNQTIAERRATVRAKRFHHHAYRCRNAEETRHFYEDILGFKLVQAAILSRDLDPQGNNFCHVFFELADGSCLAFFDCIGKMVTRDFAADTGFDHHVAVYVTSDEDMQYYKNRLDAAGIENSYVDHIVYRSLYCLDPNGLNLEFCGDAPITAEYELKSEITAHHELETWMKFAHPTPAN